MSVKILVDMNLSPSWVDFLSKNGLEAVHWSEIGKPNAKDQEIIKWARTNKHIVFTHDLDFGAILALTQASSPSVIQIRTQNVLSDYLGKTVVSVIKKSKKELSQGVLIVIDELSDRIRFLPLINLN